MRYKEVEVNYKGHKVKVMVHRDNTQESDEELEAKAIEILDRSFNNSVLRTLGWE